MTCVQLEVFSFLAHSGELNQLAFIGKVLVAVIRILPSKERFVCITKHYPLPSKASNLLARDPNILVPVHSLMQSKWDGSITVCYTIVSAHHLLIRSKDVKEKRFLSFVKAYMILSVSLRYACLR